MVDPYWELHDPTPCVWRLFAEFNETFFWRKLGCVEVLWNKQMTSCAGTCIYRGGLCCIRLSKPLLGLRPRKDLVETLLHEMIHALLFVTHNNKDRSGHGPEFRKHMQRINRASGANITVYHDFHEEVKSLRVHKWRCDGPCRFKRPFFGYVARSINRAPAPSDLWWPEHHRSCGGTFHKVAGPEQGKGKRKRTPLSGGKAAKSGKMADGADIRTMFGAHENSEAPSASAPAGRNQGGPSVRATGVSNSFPNIPGAPPRLPPATVHTPSHPKPPTERVVLFTGTGHTLGGNALWSKLVGSMEGPSSVRSTSASSAVSGTSSVQRGSPLPAAKNNWTGTVARPKSPKPSCLVQKTLVDLVGQRAPPAKPVSHGNGAAKMKLIVELLSSDSESESDDGIVLPAGGTPKTAEQRSGGPTSLPQPSSSHVTMLVHCPVCECFIEEQFINAHLDACLARGN